MTRGQRRLRAPVCLVAVGATLLVTGGIVAGIGTAGADSAGTDLMVASCRADLVIVPNDRLAPRRAHLGAGRRLIGRSVTNRVAGVGGVQGSGGTPGSHSGCAGGTQPAFADTKDPGVEHPGRTADGALVFPRWDTAGGPFPRDFAPIELMAPTVTHAPLRPTGSAGSFTSPCGINAEGHHNSDNFMAAPGQVNSAHHIHDYVGNLSTDAFSTAESLAAAGTTCTNGDKSPYMWPVLRNTTTKGTTDAKTDGGGLEGNRGAILRPAGVQLQFRGNPTEQVTAMPDNLMIMTGDAKAVTHGEVHAHAAWTCTGFEDRTTTKYPLCPPGSQLVRILEFPSCWDAKNLDSADHRAHVVFPQQDGSCSAGKRALPQLRITLTFDRPVGRGFAVDTFPDQQHNPVTDHADFMNLMPAAVMAHAVACINTGRTC
jgi:hypothetical protein